MRKPDEFMVDVDRGDQHQAGEPPVSQLPAHAITIQYTNGDDGIWLRCSCGWVNPMGYWPTVDDVVVVARDHRLDLTHRGLA